MRPVMSGDDSYDEGVGTEAVRGDPAYTESVRVFRIEIPGEAPWTSEADRCSIGSHPSNDLVLRDPTISRFHCEIVLDARGARLRDLSSRNGTLVDSVTVFDCALRNGSRIQIGRTVLQFRFGKESNQLLSSPHDRFGLLVGRSPIMRHTFALLERAAGSDATILLEGETGTGKEATAESVHRSSPRADRALVVVDCGAVPKDLLDSELFGHERGAFTGAVASRTGAFEEANGSTLFLDEIGELPLELQPKLLRAIEQREIRRVGSNTVRNADFRLIAATNRDLRTEVNAGRFRADLFFRLAVIRVPLPPLRARLEDLPQLVESLLGGLDAPPAAKERLRTEAFLATLRDAAWPGNVRELRNYLERCLVFREALPIDEGDAEQATRTSVGASVPFDEARRRALEAFERDYVQALLVANNHNVAQAARAAGIAREYVYRLMRRHGLKR